MKIAEAKKMIAIVKNVEKGFVKTVGTMAIVLIAKWKKKKRMITGEINSDV